MAEIIDPDPAEDGVFLSEELVQSPIHTPAQTGLIDFGGLLDPALVLNQDLTSGNGGQAWPAGIVLAKYLLRSTARDALKTSSMSVSSASEAFTYPFKRLIPCYSVELGAGGGLVGLAIAAGCRPTKVLHITDQTPMLALMQHNIALNDLQGHVVATVYNWGGDRPPSVPEHPDIVLAADCVYFEPAFPLLHQTLRDLIGPQTTCYFCFKKRRRADLHFIKAVKKEFLMEEIMNDPDREVYTRENILLCTIRMKPDR